MPQEILRPGYIGDKALAKAPWMRFALAEWGVREGQGEAKKRRVTPRIVDYLKTCSNLDGKPSQRRDSTSWCSAFVNWCMRQAGFLGTNSARAASWQDWGIKLIEPRYGAVTVFCNHVGFFCYRGGPSVFLLGGNQADLGWQHEVKRQQDGRCPAGPWEPPRQDSSTTWVSSPSRWTP